MSIDTDAAMACQEYLNGCGNGWATEHQRYVNLPDAGKEVWRNVVRQIRRTEPISVPLVEKLVAAAIDEDFETVTDLLARTSPVDRARMQRTLLSVVIVLNEFDLTHLR